MATGNNPGAFLSRSCNRIECEKQLRNIIIKKINPNTKMSKLIGGLLSKITPLFSRGSTTSAEKLPSDSITRPASHPAPRTDGGDHQGRR